MALEENEPKKESGEDVQKLEEPAAVATVETEEETKHEPIPEIESKPEEDPIKPVPDEKPDPSVFLDRLNELELNNRELKAQIDTMREADALKDLDLRAKEEAAKTAAQVALLENYGILKAEYSKLAPNVSEADPTTEEGREGLRRWVIANPGLFGKAPALPSKNADQNKEERKTFDPKPWKWREIWKA